MNERALDRKRFEAIEAYVLGTMPSDERAVFERELAHDAQLRAEVDLQRENTMAVELGGMDRLLEQIGAEQRAKDEGTVGPWTIYLKYAAVIAVLLSAAVWWMARPNANERLFAEHFTPEPALPVTMSATDDLAFQDAMVAYKLGDHQEARDKWSAQLQGEPGNDTLHFYIASASLAVGDAEAAIPLFKGLADDAGSVFRDRSRWQLFLAYLKIGDREALMAMPLDDDAEHGEQVRSIKAHLR